ncbi:MAG TPA: IPExxxVDY family protein [Cyclobacteriaceae bacterium]|nr:IPExxxVDY family protein [Cyclobacteriaceae bacterium]
MKKSKLVIDYEYDFELIGIRSSAKGYKLAWELNNHLGIHLIRQPDLMVGFKKDEEKNFSFYAHETRLNRLKLFKNKPVDSDTGKYFLIPEFHHFDFILLVQMDDSNQREAFLQQLKTISSIELTATIPLDGLKSKSNFIF